MSENKIYILDNGSVASKLLQHENKDAEVVKVSGTDLVEQFTKFENKNGRKIYLPFTVEQLADNNEQLRKDIQKVESLGFKNLIVLPYEGNTDKDIEYRAKNIDKKEVLKGEISYPNHGGVVNNNDTKESTSNASRRDKQVQYLP